ncbi:MAG: Dipeptide transport system permease protein DppB [Myxococcaceae bacterium]|nr:Dipeptide transport system permease protein DppB [Myxococcaceae bacterium]
MTRVLVRSLVALLVRGAEAALVLVVLATLVFFALRLLPGDPAALILGDQASAADLAALRARLHFDDPLHVQYAHFLRALPTLDFGDSLRRPGVSSGARVVEALGPTSALAGLAVLLGAAFGIAAAVLAVGPWLGRHRVWIERGLVTVAASPLLAFAPLLTYVLAARWKVVPLPGDPDAGFAGLLFASGLLAIPLGAHVGRIGRAALLDIERAPFLSVARAKGGTYVRVWLLHAIPASTGPIVTVVATQLGALLGGAVVLERLFERAGLGTLILESYATRDLPVLEAAVIAAGGLFVLAQGVAGALHAAFDPRVRR